MVVVKSPNIRRHFGCDYSAAQHVDEGLSSCLTPEGQLVCETARHLHVLKAEQKAAFIDTVGQSGLLVRVVAALIV